MILSLQAILRTDALEELLTEAQLQSFGLPSGEKATALYIIYILYY